MTLNQDLPSIQAKVSAAIREHWKAFLFEGILLVVLGLAAMIVPPLAVVAGGVLLAQPVEGTQILTIVVGAYFLAEGVTTIMYALEHRRELSQRWSWMLVAGLMDILIAALIITGLPGSALWAIGLLVGINLLFGGATLIGVALAARNS